MRFRSTNPVFGKILNKDYVMNGAKATYAGIASKVLFYLALTLAGAFGGLLLATNNPQLFQTLLIVSVFTTFIFALVAMVSPRASRVFGSLYCLGQGMLVGVISLAFEIAYPGTIMITIFSTVVVLMVVGTLFLTNLVKVNSTFMRFLTTFSISVIISMLFIAIFGAISGQPYFSGMNIIISLIMIFLATLYILFDLENIRQVVEGGAPKMLEWYAAFGLMFTILWLYMEILPLVARVIASRD